MKLKATTKYYLNDAKKTLGVYYIVIVGIYLINTLLNLLLSGGESHSSTDSVTLIFLFVVGLCSFKENFLMMTQMGVSRRSIFLGRLVSAPVIALVAAVADRVLIALFGLITRAVPGMHVAPLFGSGGSFSGVVYGVVMALLGNLLAILLGNFITVLYYRLGTLGKIIVSVGVPVGFQGLLFLLMAAGLERFRALGQWLTALARWVVATTETGMMLNLLLVLLAGSALFAGLSWALARRAVVKQ